MIPYIVISFNTHGYVQDKGQDGWPLTFSACTDTADLDYTFLTEHFWNHLTDAYWHTWTLREFGTEVSLNDWLVRYTTSVKGFPMWMSEQFTLSHRTNILSWPWRRFLNRSKFGDGEVSMSPNTGSISMSPNTGSISSGEWEWEWVIRPFQLLPSKLILIKYVIQHCVMIKISVLMKCLSDFSSHYSTKRGFVIWICFMGHYSFF